MKKKIKVTHEDLAPGEIGEATIIIGDETKPFKLVRMVFQEPKVTEAARLRAKISAEKNARTHVK